jgi:WD repeat-containing protein 26
MAKFTNGHGLKADSNGTGLGLSTHKHSNGTSLGAKELSPTWEGHQRSEVTRILVQSLNELGYHTAARTLSIESGFQVEGSLVSAFRSYVMAGNWAETESLLFGHRQEFATDSASRGLPLVDGINDEQLKFWIRQQKYLELLEKRDLSGALLVLRQELTPLNQDSDRLHSLTGLLMCPSAEDLRVQANWDGASGESRRFLLSELSKAISPTVMIPEHRLANLFDQVKHQWIDNCLYHNTTESPSLYVDHVCDRSDFPCFADVSFNEHEGEVWYVAFSNGGKFLATAGSDKFVHVYEIQKDGFSQFLKLKEHGSGVCFLAWSPDDSKLITCTRESDNKLRVLDIESNGQLICEVSRYDAPTTAACWLPDNESFVVSSLDIHHSIEIHSIREGLLYRFSGEHLRVYDLALSPDNTRLVALTEHQMIVYDFVSKQRIREYSFLDGPAPDSGMTGGGIDHDVHRDGDAISNSQRARQRRGNSSSRHHAHAGDSGTIYHGSNRQPPRPCLTSVSISSDSQYMLISQNPNWIRMMEIDTGEEVRVFDGHKQEQFMIRSSWGGASEAFVASGSEGLSLTFTLVSFAEFLGIDNRIYVWRASTGQLVERLDGHTACVNCIAWNPVFPGMFASASDDGSVKV